MRKLDKRLLLLGVVVFSTVFPAVVLSHHFRDTVSHDMIFLDSDIVELAYASFNRSDDDNDGISDNVTVSWLLHNIVDRTLNVSIDVEFYDKRDNLVYNETKQLLYFPPDYTEHLILPANKVSYHGSDADNISYVVLRVREV